MIVLLMVESYLWNYGVFTGDYRVFRDDVVFWVTFSSVALMIPVLFVGCPRIVSYLFFLPGRRGKRVSDHYPKCSPVGCVENLTQLHEAQHGISSKEFLFTATCTKWSISKGMIFLQLCIQQPVTLLYWPTYAVLIGCLDNGLWAAKFFW